jgi:hypothetical protein
MQTNTVNHGNLVLAYWREVIVWQTKLVRDLRWFWIRNCQIWEVWPVHCNWIVNWMQFGIHWYINTFYSVAIAWSPQHCGPLAAGGDEADQCILFWNPFSGQSVQHVDTGSQVSNVAWSKDSSELASILHIKVVLSIVAEMIFLTKVRILLCIWYRWWNLLLTYEVKFENIFQS